MSGVRSGSGVRVHGGQKLLSTSTLVPPLNPGLVPLSEATLILTHLNLTFRLEVPV